MKASATTSTIACAAALLLGGCASQYAWRPSVPADMRRVAVPTFRNESDVTELGAVAARQIAREFQREGTFKICPDEPVLEIQGTIKKVGGGNSGYDRRSGLRLSSNEMVVDAEVSVVDKRERKVLIDNRHYTARATYTSGQDRLTAHRNASGDVAVDLARQVVDDVVNMNW